MPRPHTYGGQAVIEGVMMKGPDRIAIAVRKPDGEIAVTTEPFQPVAKRLGALGWPFLRGPVTLVETVTAGVKALLYSAKVAGEEDELTAGSVAATLGLALALAVGLFIVLPTVAVHFLRPVVAVRLHLNLLEGAVRILIFAGYVAAISLYPEIRRVLAYHGAEHKVIAAHEAGGPLTVEAARRSSALHPRCGTSFLLYVMVVSVVLYSFFGWPGIVLRVLLRLALLPLVAGIAYEFVRLAERQRWARVLVWPGLVLQRLTTREPDDAQLEVAIAALEAVAR